MMNFGRYEDPEHTERFFGNQPQIMTAAADILAQDDNADVDLCDIYTEVTGKPWNSRNQNPRGFCVGFGNAKMATLSIAMMVKAGEISWPGADVAIEPIYGGSRWEVGTLKYRSSIARGGDGSVGSWAAEWLLEWGVLLMQKYPQLDLSNYSESRCDEYGRRGVPDNIEPTAKQYPLKAMTRVDTGEQAWRMIGQLFPLVHCSNQGFTKTRDSAGISRASGSWVHCAGWSARFTLKGGTRVLRYDNSWDGREDGSGYLGGNMTVQGMNGEIKLNGNQFLVPLEVVDRMCQAKETYAMAGPKGFTLRRPLFLI